MHPCGPHDALAVPQKLTRCEWSSIRSNWGRPRRLSGSFLKGERQKLSQYRDKVRDMQQCANRNPAVMPQVPRGWTFQVTRPIEVGQCVTAYHKKAKILQRGQVLTADYEHHKYRIQFERAELGSFTVRDYDLVVHGLPKVLVPRMSATARAADERDVVEGLYTGAVDYYDPDGGPMTQEAGQAHAHSLSHYMANLEVSRRGIL